MADGTVLQVVSDTPDTVTEAGALPGDVSFADLGGNVVHLGDGLYTSYFHLLRRQAYHRPRRPLIVFTPKSMLRLKTAASAVEDFTTGTFEPVLPDTAALDVHAVTRVLMASGKVVHDLEAERAKRQDGATAILRVEQLAPLPADEIALALKAYPGAEIMWVQDEPVNQGAWPFMALNLPAALADRGETRALHVASRAASASPASGSSKKHAVQQAELIARAFNR